MEFVEKEYKTQVFALSQTSCHPCLMLQEIFPPQDLIFNALNLCPLAAVRVVILGQGV